MKIGLSLSFCVRAIANGDIELDDVSLIVTGTKAKNDEEWNDIVDRYCAVYWSQWPEQARIIANYLYCNSKIFQPRLYSGQAPCLANGYWVESINDIQWV